jgi:exosortase A-associated hydrolase 2
VAAEAFFLPTGAGDPADQRFCIHHPAATPSVRALIVYVHPFAEEMNKSRRMAALQSRAFAAAGCSVLQIDLLGCGDSSGDFGDARWEAWVDDIVRACEWLQRTADAPLWIWGLRAGCLLAVAAAAQLGRPCHFLFWQPPGAGKPLLQQFLRLKLAADMAAGKGLMDGLRRQLANGEPVEIAGYALGAELANGLEQARLTAPAAAGRVEWIELSSRDDPTLLPASQVSADQWRAAGWSLRTQVVNGAAFWQTVEIEEAPNLIDATLAAVTSQPETIAA